jgi:hypothetical protein
VVQAAGEPEIVTERRHEMIAPPESKAYMAFYEYLQPAQLVFLPSAFNNQPVGE